MATEEKKPAIVMVRNCGLDPFIRQREGHARIAHEFRPANGPRAPAEVLPMAWKSTRMGINTISMRLHGSKREVYASIVNVFTRPCLYSDL